MSNYSKNTQITFYFKNENDIDTLIEHFLAFNGLLKSNKGVFVAYVLKGHFSTQKSQSFLNDFIARMFLSFAAEHQKNKIIDIFDTKAKELKTLTQSDQLKSLQNIKHFEVKNFVGKGDWLFLALKEWAIQNIRKNKILNYWEFETWALNNFLYSTKKCKSDIVCKTRSIFNYYENRNFEIETTQRTRKTKNEKDLKMTRQENLQRYKDKKQAKTQKTIQDFFEKLAQIDKENNPFLKKNGDYHLSKIADFLKITRATLYKHLENLQVII